MGSQCRTYIHDVIYLNNWIDIFNVDELIFYNNIGYFWCFVVVVSPPYTIYMGIDKVESKLTGPKLRGSDNSNLSACGILRRKKQKTWEFAKWNP